VTRRPAGNNRIQYDYHLSNAPVETPLKELARVVKAEHRIEDCLKRAKSEAGLSDYEVRTWTGWHHHQILSLIALWFLIVETRRGKKVYPCHDGSAGSDDIVRIVASSLQPPIPRLVQALCQTKKRTPRTGSV
jgi:SRSO17 transposase